jgi:TolB-like protein/DNA-binding winged helix-turn-helix (wHTH) protein/tetratricopeptide (TPR) repeat protein
MHTIAHTVFGFEGYALDVTRGLLSAEGREIPLRPKSFEVLRYLVENADRLVSKDELMQAIWPSVIVTDDSLKRCVSDVRLALSDGEQRIIKTVPRRGYVFAAPVSSSPISARVALIPAATSTEATNQPSGARELPIADATGLTRRKQLALAVLAGLVLVLIAAAGAWYWGQPAGLPLADRPSIAVLPFVNIGGDPEQDYFSDGMSEDLITSLSKFADLFVIARNSAFTYKGKQIELSRIGRELGARYLVQGSVRRDADRLRITAQLVEGATGKQLWAERYDRELAGLFSVQDDVTQKIVVTLVAHVTKSERDRALRKPPESLAAYDYYLRANALMKNIHREKRGETIAAARQLYQQALDADPHYAPAVQGLAHTYVTAWQELTAHEPIAREYQQKATLDRALLLAQSAVELDGNLAEAHATLGFILRWQYRLNEGIAEFERAFALNPNLADGRFGNMLNHQGRAAEAIEFMKRIMRLDPFHPAVYFQYLGNAYYLTGNYETALELIRTGASRMPGYRPVFVWLAAAAAQSGRDDEARQAAAEVLRLQPDFTITKWLQFLRFTRHEDADRLAEGLRKVGLPE